MDAPRVSVVVVSHGRPRALSRCLIGLSQLDWPAVEVVVVACAAGCAAVRAHAAGAEVKLVEYNATNISSARNRGIAAAAGDIVAFIDDDAVPEPTWLLHLISPFSDTEVAGAGGFVIGRNGISLQWGARSVDRRGAAHPLQLSDDRPILLRGSADRAVKTEGTNMAFRREVLAGLGGFDPAFRFYLDETDLNWRLAEAGHATALVPLARVHHGFYESARRARDRTPRDLAEIGASTAVFLRKHADPGSHDRHLARLGAEQRARLIAFMQRGPLDAADVARLMRGLKRGIAEGRDRDIAALSNLPRAAAGFRPFPARPGAPRTALSGRRIRPLRERAAQLAQAGDVVTIFCFSPTALYHRMYFTDAGIWEQRGGLFGRSDRDQPLFRPMRHARRTRQEVARLAPVRLWSPGQSRA
ncbi:glycosyltransferase family 2 protein [Roseivivax sediminis]|uniref:Glycosyltransferase, GT2 family n=1 Tax=Roseivivax sediminis TaxID=936889 RepID=A0A1I2B3F9_9RHOB|nr:glycosyltransferase [Roseivivax sediminis]SFE50704.1 Glycosyltransferase, GT2 family [Roseivivax sediminis]